MEEVTFVASLFCLVLDEKPENACYTRSRPVMTTKGTEHERYRVLYVCMTCGHKLPDDRSSLLRAWFRPRQSACRRLPETKRPLWGQACNIDAITTLPHLFCHDERSDPNKQIRIESKTRDDLDARSIRSILSGRVCAVVGRRILEYPHASS